MLGTTAVALLAWASAADPAASAAGAVRTGLLIWLAGLRTSFRLGPSGGLTLAPLGLTLLLGGLLLAGGRWAARRARMSRRGSGRRLVGGLVAGHVVVAVAVLGTAGLLSSGHDPIRPDPGPALLGAGTLALAAGTAVASRVTGAGSAWWSRLPRPWRAQLVGAGAGVLVVLAGSALLLAGLLVGHLPTVAGAAHRLAPGVVGGAVLLVLQVALAPNAVMFVASVALGPGFALGVDSHVGADGVHLGALPGLPLLALAPTGHQLPAVALALLGLPLVAGVVAGVLVTRRSPTLTLEQAGLAGLGAGLGGAVGLTVLAVLAGGSLGRMATIGPVGWQVGVAAGLEIGVSAAVAAGLAHLVLAHRASPGARGTVTEPARPPSG